MAVAVEWCPRPERPRPTRGQAASSPDLARDSRKLPALGPLHLTMAAGNSVGGDPWPVASAVLLEGKGETCAEGSNMGGQANETATLYPRVLDWRPFSTAA